MKKVILALAILLFCASGAQAHDKWTKEQKLRQLACTSVIFLDYLQTRDVVEDPHYREGGAFGIIGTHPDDDRVNYYFAAYALIQFIVAHNLPSDLRDMWQVGTIFYEVAVVTRNNAIGIGFRF